MTGFFLTDQAAVRRLFESFSGVHVLQILSKPMILRQPE